jgi:hypothetical protein
MNCWNGLFNIAIGVVKLNARRIDSMKYALLEETRLFQLGNKCCSSEDPDNFSLLQNIAIKPYPQAFESSAPAALFL